MTSIDAHENYIADIPVNTKEEDKFQRFPFSKRIAETILNRESPDSIVIGLYGIWGEGKTSVLNFIRSEVKLHHPNVVQFTFNPWRFTDEAALLTSFFNTLAVELEKSLPQSQGTKPEDEGHSEKNRTGISKWWNKWWNEWWNKRKGPLKTSTETIGEMIQEYGRIASIFGVGEAAEAIGKAISNVDVETLKERIEELLKKNKKKIVIFIDDIDRLDKNEIHSVFRLVKLTGNFPYTTYVLSFDNNMVALALGERFGGGDRSAGEQFLEKIIQVPLTLPLAQKAALKNYCFSIVNNALDTNQITLTEDEAARFVQAFTGRLLNSLSTPRFALRYGNALSFALPLLKGEVNIVDLMLIEAIHIFYPRHYDFIKRNPEYFIKPFKIKYVGNRDEEKITLFKKELEELDKDLNDREKSNIQELLRNLFPFLETAFGNIVYGDEFYTKWFKAKKLCSPEYFNRYFSYTVIEVDISDVAFEDLISHVKTLSLNESIKKIENLIKQATPNSFLIKIRSIEKDIDWETTQIIAPAIAKLGHLFPMDATFLYSFGTPLSQAAIFVFRLLENQKDKNLRLELMKELLRTAEPYDFAVELIRWCHSDEEGKERFFLDDQFKDAFRVLKERTLREAGEEPIFDKFPGHARTLCKIWSYVDKTEFENYIKGLVEKNPLMVRNFIRAMTPTLQSSLKKEPFKGDLGKEEYEGIKAVMDTEYLYKKVMECFGKEIVSDTFVSTQDGVKTEQTDENILKQFAYWYNRENKQCM